MGSIKVFKLNREVNTKYVFAFHIFTIWLCNTYNFRASSSLPLLLPPMLMDSGKKYPFNSNLIKYRIEKRNPTLLFLIFKGDLLVDGGYVNNLPVDVMRSNFGANIVIAGTF